MYDYSQVQIAVFLSNVLNLFNDTLTESYKLPALRFFMAVLAFLVVVSFLARMIRQGHKGRL